MTFAYCSLHRACSCSVLALLIAPTVQLAILFLDVSNICIVDFRFVNIVEEYVTFAFMLFLPT